MDKLKLLKNIVSRIRWNVVISIIAVFLFIIIAIFFFPSGSGNLSCSNGVCIKPALQPDTTSLKGETTVYVDVLNRDTEDLKIFLDLEARNEFIYFKETGDREIEKEISLGAGESMTLDFDVKANATYPGKFRIDVSASHEDKEITKDIYLKLD